MVNICFVINYFANNGPSNVILNIISNLSKEKYSISLITLFEGNDAEIISELKARNIQVYECKSLSRLGCILGQQKEFDKIIQKCKFDIIHTHGFIPDILSSRLKTGAKRISTLHNNMFEDYVQMYGKIKASLYIGIHLRALKKLDRCVGCSKAIYQVMSKYLQHITYVRNGIKPKFANHNVTRSELNIPDDAVVFIFSGNLSYGKNVQFLVREFVKFHNENEYLIMLGDGAEKNKCEQMSDKYVRILGFQTDPTAFYNISNIYVSASRSEGFSISVLEALSCGLGLFLSNIPSHNEVFSIEKELYLGEIFSIIPSDDNFNTSLLTIRKQFNNIDKEAIKNFQSQKLSDKSMTEGYEKVYQEILNK